MCIITEFSVIDPFSLIFAVIPPWKLGHPPNITYIFGIFGIFVGEVGGREGAISSASFTALELRFYFFMIVGRLQGFFNATKCFNL